MKPGFFALRADVTPPASPGAERAHRFTGNFNPWRFCSREPRCKLLAYLMLLPLLSLVAGCADPWEEHTTKRHATTTYTLYQYLKADPGFSTFTAMVEETGHAELLSSQGQFTVFALSNSAMAVVPRSYLDDAESRRLFVSHHITSGRFSMEQAQGSDTLVMRSQKRLLLQGGKLDNVVVGSSSPALANGFVNTVEQAILPRPTIWDYVEGIAPSNRHVNYLKSLTRRSFEPSLSTRIGVNDQGQPVYDSVFIYRNQFNDNIANLASEAKSLTLFIVEDQVLSSEFQKFQRFFRVVDGTTASDSAEILMQVTRDYVFGQAFAPGEIPLNPVSIGGVPVNFSQAAVVSYFKASNGYVYTLSAAPVNIADRVRPIVLEGESPLNYFGLPTERAAARGYLRIRANASGGRDFVVDNHITGPRQRLTDGLILPAGRIPSTTYRVYWRAINDFSTSYRFPSANQLLQALGTTIPMAFDRVTGRATRFAPPAMFSGFIPVTATAYSTDALADEVLVGTLPVPTMREIYLQLLPEGVTTHHMAVTVDYIRLVPVLD